MCSLLSQGTTFGCGCACVGVYFVVSIVVCFLVLLIPSLGHFIRPFDVASDGARYFRTILLFMNGNPLS